MSRLYLNVPKEPCTTFQEICEKQKDNVLSGTNDIS